MRVTMFLSNGAEQKKYLITNIKTDDEEIKSFLFSLGCYSGESITVISKKKKGLIISVKDARYSIDMQLADYIKIE